jgi:hypothetical protein
MSTSQFLSSDEERARQALSALLNAAGPGVQSLTCMIAFTCGASFIERKTAVHPSPEGRSSRDLIEQLAPLLAIPFDERFPGTAWVVLRTHRVSPNERHLVRGWIVEDGWLTAISAARMFDIACTGSDGEIHAPEPEVECRDGLVLPRPDDGYVTA